MALDYSLNRYKPDPRLGNSNSGSGIAHLPQYGDMYGIVKQNDPFYDKLMQALSANRWGDELALAQMGVSPGDYGAQQTAATQAIAQLQNPAQFVMNQRGAYADAMGRAEGAMAGAKPARELAGLAGGVGDIAKAGLDVWGAVQDEKDANAEANEQIRQAEHQARQQTRESGSLIDDTRRNFASQSPATAARRAMRGGNMARSRIYWDGGL